MTEWGREFQKEEELGTNECKKAEVLAKGLANYMDKRNEQTCKVEIEREKIWERSNHSHREF